MSHQISSLNTLQDQVQTLKEENDSLKKLNFSAEESHDLETQLAKAQSEAFFNLSEKIKVDQELSKANNEIRRLKEAANWAKAAEDEVLSLKNKLQDEQG